MYGTLIERLEKATGPDRELDAVIWCALEHPDMKPARNFFYRNREEWGFFKSDQPRPGTTFYDAPYLTASLDAAIGIVERLLPGWGWSVNSAGMAMVFKETPLDQDTSFSHPDKQDQDNPPQAALLIALLKALEAREGSTND